MMAKARIYSKKFSFQFEDNLRTGSHSIESYQVAIAAQCLLLLLLLVFRFLMVSFDFAAVNASLNFHLIFIKDIQFK